MAKTKNYHERPASSPCFKPGKWFSRAGTWCWSGMNTAPLLHAPNPGSSHHISPPLSLSPRFPAPCPGRAGALGAQVCPQIPRGEGPRGTAPSGLSPPPPSPHLVAVGAVALAEDHDAVGGDEGPHAELQPVPVRESGLSRRRRHGGTGAFPAAAALTPGPGRARPFRSGQRDETDRPIRRERGGTICQ